VTTDNVLTRIIAHKQQEVAAAKLRCPLSELQRQLADAPVVRDFVKALHAAAPMALIAEVKKASPSAGLIRSDFDPVAIGRTYEAHGASCLSVLTDEHFFKGHLDFLRAVRANVSIPVLRKDFFIDPYQVVEARAAGADCILLIAECLDDDQLALLYQTARELGMHCLIELYDPENLERVLKVSPPLVGVNNRDLRTFVTDLNQTLRIQPHLPPGILLVSESGIRTPAEVQLLQKHGVGAILVGESLMRQPDLGAAVDALLGKLP